MNPWKIWIPVGKTEEYGRVYLVQYAEQSRSEVAHKIMSRAWEEGFRGSLDERLKELNWEIVECELKELQHTCRSCKWWTEPEDQLGEEHSVLHPFDPDTLEPMVFPFEVRICKCPRILFGEHPVESCGACVIDGSGYMAKLLTAENFSCSLHEPA